MMEPAKDRMRNYVSKPLDRACAGRVFRERNMGSPLVIIDGIFHNRWHISQGFGEGDPR